MSYAANLDYFIRSRSPNIAGKYLFAVSIHQLPSFPAYRIARFAMLLQISNATVYNCSHGLGRFSSLGHEPPVDGIHGLGRRDEYNGAGRNSVNLEWSERGDSA